MPSLFDHIVKTFGEDAIERRLSEHVETARSDATAFMGAGSHGLGMLRRRDEALLQAMCEELRHAAEDER